MPASLIAVTQQQLSHQLAAHTWGFGALQLCSCAALQASLHSLRCHRGDNWPQALNLSSARTVHYYLQVERIEAEKLRAVGLRNRVAALEEVGPAFIRNIFTC